MLVRVTRRPVLKVTDETSLVPLALTDIVQTGHVPPGGALLCGLPEHEHGTPCFHSSNIK